MFFLWFRCFKSWEKFSFLSGVDYWWVEMGLKNWKSPLYRAEAPLTIFLTRCLSKIWVKNDTKKRVFSTFRDVSRQKCVFVLNLKDTKKRVFSTFRDVLRQKCVFVLNLKYLNRIQKVNFQCGRFCLFAMHFLRLQLEEQGFPGLSYSKLTLLASDSDIWQMSVM